MNDLIEGEKISLHLVEKDGVGSLHRWLTDPNFTGTLEPFPQMTQNELEKTFKNLQEEQWWWIKSPHSHYTGYLSNRLRDGHQEITFLIDPEARKQGSHQSAREKRFHPRRSSQKKRIHKGRMARLPTLQHTTRRMDTPMTAHTKIIKLLYTTCSFSSQTQPLLLSRFQTSQHFP